MRHKEYDVDFCVVGGGMAGLSAALAAAQDRLLEKRLFAELGIPAPAVREVDSLRALEEAVAKAVAGILTNGYGSDREYEADRTAYELAKVCGFNPNGLRIALNKVDANTAKAKETFSTHPKTSDRLKKLPGGEKKKGK